MGIVWAGPVVDWPFLSPAYPARDSFAFPLCPQDGSVFVVSGAADLVVFAPRLVSVGFALCGTPARLAHRFTYARVGPDFDGLATVRVGAVGHGHGLQRYHGAQVLND